MTAGAGDVAGVAWLGAGVVAGAGGWLDGG
jgi:hypothetical protein